MLRIISVQAGFTLLTAITPSRFFSFELLAMGILSQAVCRASHQDYPLLCSGLFRSRRVLRCLRRLRHRVFSLLSFWRWGFYPRRSLELLIKIILYYAPDYFGPGGFYAAYGDYAIAFFLF